MFAEECLTAPSNICQKVYDSTDKILDLIPDIWNLIRIKYIYLENMTNIDGRWFISKLSGMDFQTTNNEGKMQ